MYPGVRTPTRGLPFITLALQSHIDEYNALKQRYTAKGSEGLFEKNKLTDSPRLIAMSLLYRRKVARFVDAVCRG